MIDINENTTINTSYYFESQLKTSPYDIELWSQYIDTDNNISSKFVLYERALLYLPNSYKIWNRYLLELSIFSRDVTNIDTIPYSDNNELAINNLNELSNFRIVHVFVILAFQRALIYLHKMPRIWINYIEHLITNTNDYTFIRNTFNKALQCVAYTQHSRLWDIYLSKFLLLHYSSKDKNNSISTIILPAELNYSIFTQLYRYSLLNQNFISEILIDWCIQHDMPNEAIQLILKLVNDNIPSMNMSKYDLYIKICNIILENPMDVTIIDFEAFIRDGISKYPKESGRLWISLAQYYIRLGNFEKSRDIFEEAIKCSGTVRDFSLLFDAYSQFCESLIAAELDEDVEDGDIDVDLLLARLEDLTNQRPLLLNSVLLRQNPHNCNEWIKRAELIEDPEKKLKTFSEAVKTIDPNQQTGKLSNVWIQYAKAYYNIDDIENADTIFARATKISYASINEKISVWQSWIEGCIKQGKYLHAKQIVSEALIPDSPVYLSNALWSLYADLEEHCGTLDSVKSIYQRMFDLKVASPRNVLVLASIFEEKKFFEDSFSTYEKGVSLFVYPKVLTIWTTYIQKFIARYHSSKIERTRQLFEQALIDCPDTLSKTLFILYAEMEIRFGFFRRALLIYDRACKHVHSNDKFNLFIVNVTKSAKFAGISRCREVFSTAIRYVPESRINDICIFYAEMELKLNEIDRVRQIFIYGAQFSEPQFNPGYWKTWEDFEERYGNEDTFREMLRIKRSVAEEFTLHAPSERTGTEIFVASKNNIAQEVTSNSKIDQNDNPEEIDIDQLGEDEIQKPEYDVVQLKVPDSVFGDSLSIEKRKLLIQDSDDKNLAKKSKNK